MDGQQELLQQPARETVDIAAIAAQIGAVADAREHGKAPTDADERRTSMFDLRGEDLPAEQGFAPALNAPRTLSGPGSSRWNGMRDDLDALPPGPRI
jgi:hypothetical protein